MMLGFQYGCAAVLILKIWCLATYVQAAHIGIAGPFRILLHKMEQCAEDKQGNRKVYFDPHLTRNRNNVESFTYDGNITIMTNMSDDINLIIHAASWSSRGGWKDNAQILRFPRVCKSLATYVPAQFKTFTMALYGYHTQCPYPPISKNVTGYEIDTTIQAIKQFIYAKFKADIQFSEKGVVLGCIRIYADTVPKVPS